MIVMHILTVLNVLGVFDIKTMYYYSSILPKTLLSSVETFF